MTPVFCITKISIHAWFHVLQNYRLLTSGGALGKGCGPLLIGKSGRIPSRGKVALPGALTTASLLFQMAVPGEFELVQMPFNNIIPAIVANEVEAGVIIHESRFTYQNYDLECMLDLGQWWENETNGLIPLGGIIISNRIGRDDQLKIQDLIRKSILFAEQHPEASVEFIKQNAQELDDDVINNHIGLYVNDYSKDLGNNGKKSIQMLYKKSEALGLLPESSLNKGEDLFIA